MSVKSSIAFIGTYTQKEGHVDGKGAGVLAYETGPKAADWKLLGSFSDIINPSYICLSPVHQIVYAVSEQGPNVPDPKSEIKVIKYDPETFEMTELQRISALGHAPCYISTDRLGKYLFVANYVSGNVIQYAINSNGTLQEGKSTQHTGKGPHFRQEAPHAHYIKEAPRRSTIFGIDLGTDQIMEYRSGAEGLTLVDEFMVTPGQGPRHCSWHPKADILFVLEELSGVVEVIRWDGKNSRSVQALSIVNGDQRNPGGADIHISADGRFVYASLRGDFNEIVVLEVDQENYTIKEIQRVPAGGRTPRNFAISPKEDYLAVASQDEDRITLMTRDQNTGMLNVDSKPEMINIKTPVCIVWQ